MNPAAAGVGIEMGTRTATTAGNIRFETGNGITFGLDAVGGSVVTASHNGLTTAMASNRGSDFMGTATALTAGPLAWTANSAGLSLNAGSVAGTTTGFAGTNISGSMTHNTAGLSINLSVAAPGAGGGIALSAGSDSNFTNGTVTFGNAFSGSFVTSNGSVVYSNAFLTTAAQSNHSHGNPTLALTNLSGTTASASNGLTLSLSAAAAGGGTTISGWNNAGQITAAGTAQSNTYVSIQPFRLDCAVVASNFIAAGSFNVGSAANNSSAFMDVSMSGVIYTRNGSTLSSLFSFSNSMTDTWSSNATGTVTGVHALTATFNATTLLPGDYWLALHVSTTNTATGGAATTAITHAISMILSGSIGSAANVLKGWAGQSNTSIALISGQGLLSSGATRASIAFSDYQVGATRAFLAPVYFGLRNATYQ